MFNKHNKHEVIYSERFSAIMIMLSNMNDKFAKMIDIMLEKQTKTALFSTKTSHSIKPPITKEDYD